MQMYIAYACMGYRSFDTAERTIQGVETMNMMRKGQVKRLDKSKNDPYNHTLALSPFQLHLLLGLMLKI